MSKIDEALDCLLKYIFCADKRRIKARQYWRKFQQIKNSMNAKEVQQLRAIFTEAGTKRKYGSKV